MTCLDPLDPEAPLAQRWTVAAAVAIAGVGVHTGASTTLTICPAPPGTGLVFRRTDLRGAPAVPATVAHVVSTHLSTTLRYGNAHVRTVEHALAALWGLGVSDAWLDLDGPEVPIGDGSALPFVEGVRAVGIAVLAGERPRLALPPLGVAEGDRSVAAIPHSAPMLSVAVDYGRPPLGAWLFSVELSPAAFARDLAPARTFAHAEDVATMHAEGQALGGSLDCAVIATQEGFSVPLRFPDEPARHKALDLVGDLALLGARWHGHVVAYKGGHGLHTRFAAAVSEGLAA